VVVASALIALDYPRVRGFTTTGGYPARVSSVLVLNGPNLNLLGTRKPEVYGSATLADVEEMCRREAERWDLGVDFRQSNHEGVLIDWVHEFGARVKAGDCIGAVFNPGAYTHTSVALHDAIEGAELPVIECHISNVHRREPFRHHSYISPVARGVVVGFGVLGYVLAINGLHRLHEQGRHPAG
jgi:3-dehydroquinate dehydratase II